MTDDNLADKSVISLFTLYLKQDVNVATFVIAKLFSNNEVL